MARYCGSVCRFCRREGEKLFLKGDRCYSSKCAVERREGGPGQHGKARQSHSDFKIQLREKQKVKRSYGVVERKFERYYEAASSTKGVTGTELLLSLERRLDNVVYRLGFGASRAQARQLVNHGHVLVNGRRVDICSFGVSAGDIIEVREKTKKNLQVLASMESAFSRIIPDWLSLDKSAAKGTVLALPNRQQMPQSYNEQLVVELYSR
ncbi:MAG: 30S ribosomal protein S4 [Proteobacteria bacterium]|nr:MAG: 30S ribosomal protein S4 [Pseudomonadota bacterium]